MNLTSITLKSNPMAQAVLDDYYTASSNQREITRVANAKKTADDWKSKSVTIPFPGNPESLDYWYLVQLFSMNRHVHANNSPYHIRFDRIETAYIADGTDLFDTLISSLPNRLHLTRIKRPDLSSIVTTRRYFDQILLTYGNTFLKKINLSPIKWRLSLPPYELLLRLSQTCTLAFPHSVAIDGYRIHPTIHSTTGLFGGQKVLGGVRYIDSIWIDQPMRIFPYLCIIRTDYGN